MKKIDDDSKNVSNLETSQKEKNIENQKIEKTNGIDEMNLSELPVAIAGRGVKESKREFIFGNKRLVIMTPTEIGLPTLEDESFLVGILSYSKFKGLLDNEEIDFVPHELFKFMGKDTGSKTYKQFADAIRKLQIMTCFFFNSWYDVKKKKYIETEEGFHLVDRFFLWYEHKKDKDDPDVQAKRCWITLGSIIRESIQKKFIKILDTDFYFSLNQPLTQKLYRLLDKWFYRQDELRIDIFELSARLGMTRYDRISKIFQVIKPACDELLKKFYIESYKLENKKIMYFKRGKNFIPKERRLQPPRKRPLTEHGEYVLLRACEVCSRDDEHFKNTIKKYINLLNSNIVDSLIGETKLRQDVKSKSKYLITLLKKEAEGKQTKLL